MNKLTIEIPLSLINETPNNYELGEQVRKLANKLVESVQNPFKNNANKGR